MFAGGTRIALELSEYRISMDIDISCASRESYRAVREQVNDNSLGELVTAELEYPRGVRADRDAVRTLVMVNGAQVKIEIINYENYPLSADKNTDIFPIPSLDRTSCFYTKLLANADRYDHRPQKDMFDILAMTKEWGDIPARAIELAEAHYSARVILPNLKKSIDKLLANPHKFHESANQMAINPICARALMTQAYKLQKTLLSLPQ